MNDKSKILEQTLGRERIKFNEPLKYHFVNGVDSTAESLYIATSLKELTQILDLTRELDIPFFVFGAGTQASIPEKLEGLVIKNRTSGIRISGVKGKVSSRGIGVDEAMVEIESGVSLQKVNEFLKEQNLNQLNFPFITNSTVGGSLHTTSTLQDVTQKIKVFSDGEISDIEVYELGREDIILSVIIKAKSSLK